MEHLTHIHLICKCTPVCLASLSSRAFYRRSLTRQARWNVSLIPAVYFTLLCEPEDIVWKGAVLKMFGRWFDKCSACLFQMVDHYQWSDSATFVASTNLCLLLVFCCCCSHLLKISRCFQKPFAWSLETVEFKQQTRSLPSLRYCEFQPMEVVFAQLDIYTEQSEKNEKNLYDIIMKALDQARFHPH